MRATPPGRRGNCTWAGKACTPYSEQERGDQVRLGLEGLQAILCPTMGLPDTLGLAQTRTCPSVPSQALCQPLVSCLPSVLVPYKQMVPGTRHRYSESTRDLAPGWRERQAPPRLRWGLSTSNRGPGSALHGGQTASNSSLLCQANKSPGVCTLLS